MFVEKKKEFFKRQSNNNKKMPLVLVHMLSVGINLEKLVLCSPTNILIRISHCEIDPCQLSPVQSMQSENLECISPSTTDTALTHMSEAELSFSKEHYWKKYETDLLGFSGRVLYASNSSK